MAMPDKPRHPSERFADLVRSLLVRGTNRRHRWRVSARHCTGVWLPWRRL